MKAVNKKNIDEFIEYLKKNIVEDDGFVLDREIEIWLEKNGRDYFINRDFNEWQEQ